MKERKKKQQPGDRGQRTDQSVKGEIVAVGETPPVFRGGEAATVSRRQFQQATHAWLNRSPSERTKENYGRDLQQFLVFVKIESEQLDELTHIRPSHVAAWRDALRDGEASNATIRRKLTAIRSLFSYLQTYGYTGGNPAHGRFVQAPAVARDGKTVGLSPHDCRRMMDAPSGGTPAGLRDRAMFAVLAFSACRVSELISLRVGDFTARGEHRVLNVMGNGGKERAVALHVEAVERLSAWIGAAGIEDDRRGPLFRPPATSRGAGRDGFQRRVLTRQAVNKLVKRYAKRLKLDPAVTVHSFRVTALTAARERGADIIDLQDFAGHHDPRTTLAYIRSRDRLSRSPAYLLAYR